MCVYICVGMFELERSATASLLRPLFLAFLSELKPRHGLSNVCFQPAPQLISLQLWQEARPEQEIFTTTQIMTTPS